MSGKRALITGSSRGDRMRYRSEVSGSWRNNRRGDDTICQRLIDSGSIASETNSRPFLHRRLWILWTTRAGPTGTRPDDLSRPRTIR